MEGRAVAEVQRQEDARPSPNSWSWKTAAPRGSMSRADSSSGRPGALSQQLGPKEPRDTAGNGGGYGPPGKVNGLQFRAGSESEANPFST